MFPQLGAAFHFHHTLVANKGLCPSELCRQLRVEVRSVRNQQNGRTGKFTASHQHACQEQHSITLSAPRSSEISTSLTVSSAIQFGMFADILKQFVSSEELRIAANYLLFLFRRIRCKYEIFHHTQQPFFSEKPLYHCEQRTDTVRCLVVGINLAPCVEEIVWSKQRTVLAVHPVAYHNERVIFEQFLNIPTIAYSQLPVSIHYGGIFLYCTLEFQHHYRKPVYIYNSVRNTFYLTLYFQLVYYTENVISLILKVYRLDKQIRLSRIFPFQRKSFRHEVISSHIPVVKRKSVVGSQPCNHTFRFKLCDAMC